MRRLSILLFALLAAACGDDDTTAATDGPSRGDIGGTGDSGSDDAGDDATDTGEEDAGTDVTEDVSADAADDAATDTRVDRDGTPVDIGNECAEITFVADNAYRAADIIWVIDTSESMDNEIAIVRNNINQFVQSIDGSGVDVRMFMVASKEDRSKNVTQVLPFVGEITVPQSYLGVCVPPPLSAADTCPDMDNPPVFVHPDVDVYSSDALERLMLDGYPQFRNYLRGGSARTHIVAVTDDSSSKDPDWFREQTRLVDPPGFSTDYVFHSIVAYGEGGCGDGDGDDYRALSAATGGVIQDICLGNWDPIFDALLEGVVNDAEIPCAFGLPEPDDGFVINYNEVNVYHTPIDGDPYLVYNVENEGECGDGGGWYWDDPREPTAIWICDSLCGGEVEGTIDIAFGCETIKE